VDAVCTGLGVLHVESVFDAERDGLLPVIQVAESADFTLLVEVVGDGLHATPQLEVFVPVDQISMVDVNTLWDIKIFYNMSFDMR